MKKDQWETFWGIYRQKLQIIFTIVFSWAYDKLQLRIVVFLGYSRLKCESKGYSAGWTFKEVQVESWECRLGHRRLFMLNGDKWMIFWAAKQHSHIQEETTNCHSRRAFTGSLELKWINRCEVLRWLKWLVYSHKLNSSFGFHQQCAQAGWQIVFMFLDNSIHHPPIDCCL